MARAGVVPEASSTTRSTARCRSPARTAATCGSSACAPSMSRPFVAHGAAQAGIVGSDVIEEFDYSELYAPVDLDIGHCRLSVAEPVAAERGRPMNGYSASHLRVATKYPNLTRRFERQGVQAECVKLNGAMELAPRSACQPDRRSRLHRQDAEGQRPGRNRRHPAGFRAADRQPRRAQDRPRVAALVERFPRAIGERQAA
jgi:ATP phosphoribosyltransferase